MNRVLFGFVGAAAVGSFAVAGNPFVYVTPEPAPPTGGGSGGSEEPLGGSTYDATQRLHRRRKAEIDAAPALAEVPQPQNPPAPPTTRLQPTGDSARAAAENFDLLSRAVEIAKREAEIAQAALAAEAVAAAARRRVYEREIAGKISRKESARLERELAVERARYAEILRAEAEAAAAEAARVAREVEAARLYNEGKAAKEAERTRRAADVLAAHDRPQIERQARRDRRAARGKMGRAARLHAMAQLAALADMADAADAAARHVAYYEHGKRLKQRIRDATRAEAVPIQEGAAAIMTARRDIAGRRKKLDALMKLWTLAELADMLDEEDERIGYTENYAGYSVDYERAREFR